jgi:Fe-S cluster assembly iron-binding protein IscA
MVRISEKAARELKDMLKSGEILRMYLTPTKYEGRHRFVPVVVKEAIPGDTVIESKGIKVAYDPAFEASLKPLVIDMAPSDESEGGERFCVWNPAIRYKFATDPESFKMQSAPVSAPIHGATGPEETTQEYRNIGGNTWDTSEAPKDCDSGCDCDQCTCDKQE